MAGKGKQYLIIEYGDKEAVKKAVIRPTFVAAYRNSKKSLETIEAIGYEIDPPEWSDDEHLPPETRIGF